MSLVPLPPLRRRDLVAFDLTRGMPCALSVLRGALVSQQWIRVLGRLLWRGRRDPLRGLPQPWPSEQEWLVRRQLRPVVLLDDVLRDDLGLNRPARLELLGRVVSETGARFLAANVPAGITADWSQGTPAERRAFAASLVRRFFNVEATRPQVEEASLSYDVTRCRFAELTADLGRPHLGPLFCAADAVFFGRPDSPLVLQRSTTIAEGGSCCDFRFRYRSAPRPAD
ncbi:MAG: L-2-amino-thiazoline-4-carboxylic acid hydrolase [Deltaproteobacteria bacterium]|nr:L-2-amino-thiazoline-4-carboxylic acid hydrolase [Deltaproteobacteria bacterium]